MHDQGGDIGEDVLWIFGYGSLMWNPGFDIVERVIARLPDYRRSFCMWSIHHRGTVEHPGLVLALDEQAGAACDGVAFAVAGAQVPETLDRLRERELISSAYLERVLPLDLVDGRRVQAVTFVVDPDHAQYCGGLARERQAEIIAHACGGRGPNDEYLRNTADQLVEMGIADAELLWLAERVLALRGGPGT